MPQERDAKTKRHKHYDIAQKVNHKITGIAVLEYLAVSINKDCEWNQIDSIQCTIGDHHFAIYQLHVRDNGERSQSHQKNAKAA